MNDETMPPEMTPDDILAAEYALGLLVGEELLNARGRVAREVEFSAAVERWELRLAPLLDEIGGAEPSPDLWPRIMAAMHEQSANGGAANADVIVLQDRLRRWKWATGLTSAAAALALAYISFLPATTSPPPAGTEQPGDTSAPMMAANFPIEGTPLRLDLMYLPQEQSIMVTALGLSPDGVHDHEIWLVPGEGAPISLGVVTPGKVTAHSVPEDVARKITPGSHLVLTREPLGGKPDGEDAGPVVSEGDFSLI